MDNLNQMIKLNRKSELDSDNIDYQALLRLKNIFLNEERRRRNENKILLEQNAKLLGLHTYDIRVVNIKIIN